MSFAVTSPVTGIGAPVRTSILSIFALAILIFPASMAGEGRAAEDPAAVIDVLHKALIDAASRDDSLSYESRVSLLEPAIASSHDFATIARLVGGRFWAGLDAGERSRFAAAFRRASVAEYASRFQSGNGPGFNPAVLQEQSGTRATVSSDLVRADGTRVDFIYILQNREDQWRIVTILVDGVSDLALQRAELTKLYDDKGFEQLIVYLKTKAEGP